ncbi:golgin subfamily A member 6-like protein 24 isoform X2 [Hyla sarda]|uniref:golgin subfamily A member 6-like protein 24 isoform X2 n=1 Tax=Hyla sarda TaxID=327740 RepID=UPI0024C22C08|nr:golgin subfamily A member 6-like protein 24 isoform X2 [Hyla sarda]
MTPCQKEISEGQEEVHHEAESQKKTSGIIESRGDDRVENFAAFQKCNDYAGEKRRAAQDKGPNSVDMGQDGVEKTAIKSVDEVVSEKTAGSDGRPAESSERVEEEFETSILTEHLHELKVVDQEENGKRMMAYEEPGIVAEAQEEAGMSFEPKKKVNIPVEGQEQAEMAGEVRDKEIKVQKQAEMAVVVHEEKAEVEQQAEQAVMVQEKKVEVEKQAELTVVVQEEKVEKQAEEAVMVQEEKDKQAEQAVMVQEEKVKQAEQAVMDQEEMFEKQAEQTVMVQEEKVKQAEQAVMVQEEKVKQAEQAVMVQEERVEKQAEQAMMVQEEKVDKQAEQAMMVQQEKVEVEEKAHSRVYAQEETENRVRPLNEAEIEPPSSRSDVESENDQTVQKETTAKSSNQGTKLIQTAQSDEEQQKIMEQLLTEINSHVCEKDVHIQPLRGDFSEFSDVQVDRGRFGHVIEVYGFSSELSAEDLMEPFKEYRNRGFRLQWVDQSHALGIFSSPEDAYAASSQMHPAMKFRPLSQGSRQSKFRAYEKPLQIHTG